MRQRGILAGAAVLALAVGATVVTVATGNAQTAPAGKVNWRPCPDASGEVSGRMNCATLSVPIDWSEPGGASISLALARMSAAAPDKRIGSLFFLPGGPGQSGVDSARFAERSLSPDLLERFDIVGFDPRGQVRSKPVTCDGNLTRAQYEQSYPATADEFATLRQTNRALAESCDQLTGPLARHVDTAAVARDIDAIRAGIGEDKISLIGTSYGTNVGQHYAELFPNRIRALTLDSNMDHAQDLKSYQEVSAVALEESFLRFVAWCDRTDTCALHGKNVPAYFDELYAKAAAGGLEGIPDTLIDGTVRAHDLARLILWGSFDPLGKEQVAEMLAGLGGDRRAVPAMGRGGEPLPFGGRPVTCQDFHFELPSFAELSRMEKSLEKLAPHTKFNPLAWEDLTNCQNWPGAGSNPPHRLKASPALPPILIANSRFDPYTPYQWAESLTAQLPSATLLTYDGSGHGVYRLSSCAQKAIDTYLLTLEPPSRGTHCPAEPGIDEKSWKVKPVSPLPPFGGPLTR